MGVRVLGFRGLGLSLGVAEALRKSVPGRGV